MKGSSGFTLAELLISAGLLLVLLGALGGALAATSRAYRSAETVVTERQDRRAAAAVLTYDVSLAGYRGATTAEYATAAAVALAPFAIVPSSVVTGSDQITVKYYEDRVFGNEATDVKTIVFSINSATAKLMRTQGGVSEEIAAGVKQLKVARYLVRGNSGGDCAIACSALPPANTVGVILSLTFTDNSTMRIPVTFHNSVL